MAFVFGTKSPGVHSQWRSNPPLTVTSVSPQFFDTVIEMTILTFREHRRLDLLGKNPNELGEGKNLRLEASTSAPAAAPAAEGCFSWLWSWCTIS
jgi:hypothetical protein